ncbi:MAG: hypothetical protein IT432_14720 [Phycisphaerales bacterium]|nr:hypothetical protein [Phycisphaerales bacterium]
MTNAESNKPKTIKASTCAPANSLHAAIAAGSHLLACVGVGLPGCAESNSRNRIGDDVTLQAFQPASQVLSSEDTQRADDPPSLTSLDRSAWEPTVYALPVDATHHRPTYRFLAPIGPRQLRRQRGEYPTTMSALELDGGSTWSRDRFFESILEPVHASLELVRMPFAMAIYQPWRRAWSPMGTYDRAPNRGERPETMEDLHDTNIPHRMTPAYEEESLFVPGDPAHEDDNSNRPPVQTEPATGAAPPSTPPDSAPAESSPAKPDGSSH